MWSKGATPSLPPEELGDKIRKRRNFLGLSQRQLADAVGVRHTHISRIERGETGIGAPVLLQLATALKMPLTDLVGNAPLDESAPRLPQNELSDDESELVCRYRRARREDRRALLRFARSLEDDPQPRMQPQLQPFPQPRPRKRAAGE